MNAIEKRLWEANNTLTSKEVYMLKALKSGKEFIYAKPGGWYLDNNKVGDMIGVSLLRKALISVEYESGPNHQAHKINEWGLNRLKEIPK